jgi:hypothetical protein
MGIAVGRTTVRAVLARKHVIHWAGEAEYSEPDDLAEVLARLVAEGAGVAKPRVARVVLERPVIQLRTIEPAPPLSDRAARRWVALEAPRLFRKNGAPLVTDGRVVSRGPSSGALLAIAAAEPLVQAICTGCIEAGMTIETIGAAAEIVPGPLDVAAAEQRFGSAASQFAAAFGATLQVPRLAILPENLRAERRAHALRRALRIGVVGIALWLCAGAIHVLRLAAAERSARTFLQGARPQLDSSLAIRRDLRVAREALAVVAAAERGRSQQLALLAEITGALPDSIYLSSLRHTPDGVLRLSGYAPMAPRAVALLERVPGLRDVRLEGQVSREVVPDGGERDRFSVVARIENRP